MEIKNLQRLFSINKKCFFFRIKRGGPYSFYSPWHNYKIAMRLSREEDKVYLEIRTSAITYQLVSVCDPHNIDDLK
jgi:hypothetical protein